jgi:hypothetical protein
MDKKRIRDQLNSSIKAMGEYINTHQIAIKQCKLDVADFEKQIKDLELKGEFDWLVEGATCWYNNGRGRSCSVIFDENLMDKDCFMDLNVYETEELCKMGHIRDVIARTKGDWDGKDDFYIWDGKAAGSYYGSVSITSYNQPKFNTAKACDEFWTDERKEAQNHFNTYN